VGLLFVGMAVGMSNFGAAVGVSCAGVDRHTRLRIIACFLVFETGMPLVGLALGDAVASTVGGAGHWLAGGLLVAVGVVSAVQAQRGNLGFLSGNLSLERIVVGSLVLSIDNLVVGFALGAFGVPVVVAALVIGAISVSMSVVALELGSRVTQGVGRDGELLAAVILICVGFAVLANVI
jgi:manganese efflux pump family protein